MELHNVRESFMRVSVLALGRNFSKTLQTRLGKNETKRETLQRFKRREESRTLALLAGVNRGRALQSLFSSDIEFSVKSSRYTEIQSEGTQINAN